MEGWWWVSLCVRVRMYVHVQMCYFGSAPSPTPAKQKAPTERRRPRDLRGTPGRQDLHESHHKDLARGLVTVLGPKAFATLVEAGLWQRCNAQKDATTVLVQETGEKAWVKALEGLR